MRVCSGCDNEDAELKQEPTMAMDHEDHDKVKSDEFAPGLEPEDPHSAASQDVLTDAQIQRATESGKLYVMEL